MGFLTRGFVVQNIVIIIVELIVSVPDLHMEIVLKLDKDSPPTPPHRASNWDYI